MHKHIESQYLTILKMLACSNKVSFINWSCILIQKNFQSDEDVQKKLKALLREIG